MELVIRQSERSGHQQWLLQAFTEDVFICSLFVYIVHSSLLDDALYEFAYLLIYLLNNTKKQMQVTMYKWAQLLRPGNKITVVGALRLNYQGHSTGISTSPANATLLWRTRMNYAECTAWQHGEFSSSHTGLPMTMKKMIASYKKKMPEFTHRETYVWCWQTALIRWYWQIIIRWSDLHCRPQLIGIILGRRHQQRQGHRLKATAQFALQLRDQILQHTANMTYSLRQHINENTTASLQHTFSCDNW